MQQLTCHRKLNFGMKFFLPLLLPLLIHSKTVPQSFSGPFLSPFSSLYSLSRSSLSPSSPYSLSRSSLSPSSSSLFRSSLSPSYLSPSYLSPSYLSPSYLSPSSIPRSSLPPGCSLKTVGACDPSLDELVDTYALPNSAAAVETCQQICQIQEGCNYFTYNKRKEVCSLYHYRYLESCQLIGAPSSPSMDQCEQKQKEADSCDSFVRENCQYSGGSVLTKISITDAHSCQQLLHAIGFVFKAEYFVYDYKKHSCVFYDSPQDEANCDALSGPNLPNIQDCALTSDPIALEEDPPAVSLKLSATCDNNMTILGDGSELATNNDWGKTTDIKIPANTQVVEIHCEDLGGTGGILASLDNGLKTDSTWLCSSNNGGNWDPAFEIGENGMKPWGVRPGISTDAKWIWAGSDTSNVDSAICKINLGSTLVSEKTWDFEDGTMQGFTLDEGDCGHQPLLYKGSGSESGYNYWTSNGNGKFYVNTYLKGTSESSGTGNDGQTCSYVDKTHLFKINKNTKISWLYSGINRVSLMEFSTDIELKFVLHSYTVHSLKSHTWDFNDLGDMEGKICYIKFSDYGTGGWQHIQIDNIKIESV